ncbi:alcohol dehydrogenase [Pseudoclavibacter endophyticus]|uniref:NAD(P)-dependent alcohol dehydrogenase n=1 Tax=Pseudoclavibacter endophyticus TaxID=1778590 RepID=A0A6H9WPT6_9MICO|nr:NAD(P)-dependent alcohol dehydrogenase [Pseudoclavibacter endophyticus]KAB1648987.1 NAD(P)-dependent alcohol dehydrogenase [Pseudoclavibacter endophyticus]GGA66494.1 alcohol dehydrogenase [Pseudoclavibacter endophyticus]
MDVKAAIATGQSQGVEIATIDLEEPREDEVLVRIVATGVCHTDLSAADGRLPVPTPVVLGHEGAGVVVEVGNAVETVSPGDHVVLSPGYCGACRQCLRGRTTYCERGGTLVFGGTRLDGSTKATLAGAPVRAGFFGQSSFAEYALVSATSVLRVDPALNLAHLAALPCGASTGAGAVLNTLRPSPDATLAVIGVGTVGMAAIMAARMTGVRTVIAVDRHVERLELATSLGATHAVESRTGVDLTGALLDLAPRGITHAFDTTGVPALISAAANALDTGGVCGFVAGTGATLALELGPMLAKGARLQGIMGGDATATLFLETLVSAYERGVLPVDRLVTEYPLHRIDRAFADMRSGATIKPVVVMDAR